jgi:hypothetical protein
MRAMTAAPPELALFPHTLRALVAPRRAVPLALVGLSLLSAEWLASASPLSLFLDSVLVAAFCFSAPALWRALFAREPRSFTAQLGAWALYALVAALIVGALAVVLPPMLGVRFTYMSEPRSLGVLLVLFLVGGWGLGRDIELEAGVLRERARAERLAIDAEHAQILALRAQLDPHFLFNTLNAIAEWCRVDPAVAERATLDLAALLRAVFDALRAPGWTLARELTVLEQLAALYATRDAARYVFRFEVEAGTSALELPPLLLLPLFENAIKHGPSAGHAGAIVLIVGSEASWVSVELRNPGAFGGPRVGGQGLASVERRLALAYGASVRLAITDADGATSVAVRLPRAPSTGVR